MIIAREGTTDHASHASPQRESDDLARINGFLRGERAAVDAYARTIATLTRVPGELFEARSSHVERIDLLSRYVWRLGGMPDTSAGTWGRVTRGLTGIANAIGDRAAIAVLEEGEDLGVLTYRGNLAALHPVSQAFIRDLILPRQYHTQRLLRRLQHRMRF